MLKMISTSIFIEEKTIQEWTTEIKKAGQEIQTILDGLKSQSKPTILNNLKEGDSFFRFLHLFPNETVPIQDKRDKIVKHYIPITPEQHTDQDIVCTINRMGEALKVLALGVYHDSEDVQVAAIKSLRITELSDTAVDILRHLMTSNSQRVKDELIITLRHLSTDAAKVGISRLVSR